MNRSNASPRSFSSDQLRAALGDAGVPARPDYLPDIVAQAGRIRQRPAWTFLERWLSMDIAVRRRGVPRAAVVFASLLLLVALLAAGAIYIGSQRAQPERLSGLPTTPGAWERVRIEIPSTHAGSVVSLAASPHGLLAVVSWSNTTQLAVSTDGRSWTFVPDDQHPDLVSPSNFGYPSVVGTDDGFLLLQLDQVWLSENGDDWRRIAGETTDPGLHSDRPDTAVVGGPGLVGIGGLNAWYSADGAEWSLAAVPALPAQILERSEDDRYAAMTDVTASGDALVALGTAEVPLAENSDEPLVVPLLWASHDGRTWLDVVDPEMESVTAVAGAPHGFVATGQAGSEAAVWFSADGEAWERVGEGAFTSIEGPGGTLVLDTAVATDAGFVVVGRDGQCLSEPCQYQEAVVWTSPDGRSWSRVPGDERFAGAEASDSVAWGPVFVVGGEHEDQPVIWISD